VSNNYTNVFGGTTIYPSDVSYISLSLTENIQLQWPLEATVGSDLVARIIDVTPSSSGFSITMPDATKTGSGQTVLFNNLTGNLYDFFIKNNAGSTIATVSPGEQWQIYLASNTTPAGTWRVFRYGASTATVQPSALVGYGLTVTGSQLSTATAVATFSSTPLSILTTDRASAFVWTGSGAATVNLPSAASSGNNYFVSVRNEGGGNVSIDPAGSETVNDASTITLLPGDSITLITDGVSWYTLGFGQKAVFAFDYTSIDLTGESSPYTLTGSELNRIAYDFIGVLTDDMEIIVPSTTQQYWVTNDTTGSYTLGLRTSSQVTPADVPQGFSAILYSDGANVVSAAASTASTPAVIQPSGGGTGITSYTIGDLIFASGVTTLSKLLDVATGNALLSGGVNTAPLWGKIGLSTHVSGTLDPANGGTGQTSYTDGEILIGNSTGNTLTKSTITAGSGIAITNGSGSITIEATGTGSGTVTSVDVSGGSTGLTTSGGPVTTSGTISIAGTLNASSGGTGLTSYSIGDIVYASGSTTLAKLADVATGNALISGGVGSAPSYGKIGLTTHVSGTLPATSGGTGQSAFVTGDLLYASSSSAISRLADVAVGNVLLSGGVGVAPSWGQFDLYNATGTTKVSNGGTGLTSYAVGDIVYATGTTTLSKLADVATGNVIISGGVGAAPSYGKVGLTTHVSGTLPVANGGTGVTSSTGSGSVVLSASPALTGTPTTGGNTIGYLELPQSTNTTLALSDSGKHLSVSSNVTIPANGSVAFPVGSAVSIYNNSALTINISITSDTLRQGGTTNTGTRTLSAYGVATVLKVASTTWVITGVGLS